MTNDREICIKFYWRGCAEGRPTPLLASNHSITLLRVNHLLSIMVVPRHQGIFPPIAEGPPCGSQVANAIEGHF